MKWIIKETGEELPGFTGLGLGSETGPMRERIGSLEEAAQRVCREAKPRRFAWAEVGGVWVRIRMVSGRRKGAK